MAFNATPLSVVPTEARARERTVIEWCGGKVGAGRIGAPVVWFDNGCVESDLIAVALSEWALGALAIRWEIVRWAADAVRAAQFVGSTIKITHILSLTTSSANNIQRECAGEIHGAIRAFYNMVDLA